MKSTKPLGLVCRAQNLGSNTRGTHSNDGQIWSNWFRPNLHTHAKQRVQPTALKDFTMAVPKFGQAVNCHFDMSSPFYVPRIFLQYIFISYIIVFFLAQPQEIQLIHTNLAVSIYLQRDPVWKNLNRAFSTQTMLWVDTEIQHIHYENLNIPSVQLHVSTIFNISYALTHVPSIQDAADSHYVARFRETKWQLLFARAVIQQRTKMCWVL